MKVVLIATGAAFMAALIHARGHDVEVFDDPTGALDYVKSNDQANALIIVDHFKTFPGSKICWEARQLATFERRLYICLIARPLGANHLTEALECGADDVLQMPLSQDELYARLRSAERLDEMHQRLIAVATKDNLTGLLNRGAFFERASSACRIGRVTAAIMVDIDHFKRVNDTWGHAAGDRALRFVAAQLSDDKAIVGRLGGEEFAILLSNSEPRAVAKYAEALRKKIAEQKIDIGTEKINLSCSFGVSEWCANDDIDGLLHRADQALYLAKKAGRNRVIVHDASVSAGRSNRQSVIRSRAGIKDVLKSDEAARRVAAMVYARTREGVVVTGADEKILMVNPAFERITGYGEAEMLGKTMRILQSGRHGREFYQAMWRGIHEDGYYCGEIWNKRKNGEIYPQLATISAVFGPAGEIINYVGVFGDIGRLKQSETRLEFFAHHDPLTLFPNRILLRLRIERAIERARRGGTMVAVLVLDLDRFKTVNNSLGHTAGDQLLVEVSARWSKRLRASDTLARIGGDEFVVLLEEIPEPQAAAALAQNLIESTAAHFVLPGDREAYVGVSVGVGLFPDDGDDAEVLIQHAGSALHLAKQNGGSAVRFYSDAMTREANCRLELEAGMRRGLERGEFVLQFQPLISLADRKIVGVEALTRWRSPSGLIPPADFIPHAEETGLIVPLGEWVLREACGRMKAWRDAGAEIGVVAVNMSPVQLDRPDICQSILSILEETGLPPHCLEIEITESALLEQRGVAEAKLTALKALGLRISIDDFGAGHSSLHYLKRFPIDKLKLDRSFIIDIPTDPTSMEIAAAIVRLARSLKVDALAEGVETEAQAEFLKICGCGLAQGYLFDKPLWESELLAKYGVETESDLAIIA